MQAIFTIVLVILIFGTLVFIHELGHFLVAKFSGVIVEEFAFGFGPKLFGKKWKGTEYRINLFPLGGYVKMIGDQDGSSFARLSKKALSKSEQNFVADTFARGDIDPKTAEYQQLIAFVMMQKKKLDKEQYEILAKYIARDYIPNHPGNYENQPAQNKLAILLAGVVMNFILGAILFQVMFGLSQHAVLLPKYSDSKFLGAEISSNLPALYTFAPEYADSNASLILKVNGQSVTDENELQTILSDNYNQELRLTLYSEEGVTENSLVLNGDGIPTNYDADIYRKVFVTNVFADSAAEMAGITHGDIIISFDNQAVSSIDQLKELIKSARGTVVSVVLANKEAEQRSVEVTLPDPAESDAIVFGIEMNSYQDSFLDDFMYVEYTNKVLSGTEHALNMISYNVTTLGVFIKESIADRSLEPISNGVGSIVAVVDITYSLVKVEDFLSILNFSAFLSVTLAFMNVLPIPLFDGGHVLFLIIEKFRGRPLSESTQEKIGKYAFWTLILLTILIVVKDILQFDWPQKIFAKLSSLF